jgi:hypothetical protein
VFLDIRINLQFGSRRREFAENIKNTAELKIQIECQK